MLDKVEEIVREVATEIVVPKFRSLSAGDIEEKAPGELVTVADRASEVELSRRLLELLPSAQVVGEEAVAADPGVLDRLAGDDPVWVIDPIDGTGNFAAGREPFGIMVALVRRGSPVLAVIHEPVAGTMALAELGAGTYLDGVRTVLEHEPLATDQLRGSVMSRYMPAELRERVTGGFPLIDAALPGHHCAAREYPDVVRGRQHFTLFWRAHPWDHAAGALIVTEAGGVMHRFDGSAYVVGDGRMGLLAARDQQVFDQVRTALLD
ncbi:inositol monophosphatase family protein [Hamadaea tsunoensis]|uniref:inositol monophosphatase family protein n=1 Tax=Hamadaea tsunoensis TaxID=53368 RepID=UPI000408F759|nr:inositol monophosphatase family protein [Hamadaea tsunoensis]